MGARLKPEPSFKTGNVINPKDCRARLCRQGGLGATRSHGSVPAGLVSAGRVAGSQEVGEGSWLFCALLDFLEIVGPKGGSESHLVFSSS